MWKLKALMSNQVKIQLRVRKGLLRGLKILTFKLLDAIKKFVQESDEDELYEARQGTHFLEKFLQFAKVFGKLNDPQVKFEKDVLDTSPWS